MMIVPGAAIAQESAAAGENETFAEPSPPPARRFSLGLGPTYAFVTDDDTREIVGPLYGALVTFKYHLIEWVSVSATSGYLRGYQKQDVRLDYATYRRVSTTSATPALVGFQAEILPRGRVNPFVGGSVGGMYLALLQDPEDIRSNVPLYYDELQTTLHQWLFVGGADLGLDVRISEWAGVFASGYYRRTGTTKIHVEIPGAARHDELDLAQAGGTAGLWVYF